MADLRCCCRSPIAAAAAGSSPLLLDLDADGTCSHLDLATRRLQRVAAAVAAAYHCCCTPLRCCCCTPLHSALMPICCSAAAPCEAAAAFGILPKLCYLLPEFSPRLRPGRKTKDTSRTVTCEVAFLGCVSMCRCSGLVPRAAQCLEGHWVKMRPGATVMAHPHRRMDVGCHRPRSQRGTSCCAVT
jgi:hypothetical protein